jgi:hypothetical protein
MVKKVEKESFNKLKLFNKFEEELIKKEKDDIRRKIFIFEELLNFANKIKRFSQDNWKDEIKNDIKYARVINGIRKTS